MKPIWKPGLRLQSNNSSLSLPRGHLFCGGTLWLYNHKVLVAQQQSPWLFPPRNALHTKLSFLWTIKFGAEIKLKEEYCAIVRVEFTFLEYVQQCTATVGIDLRWNYSFTTVSCSRGSLWPVLRHFFWKAQLEMNMERGAEYWMKQRNRWNLKSVEKWEKRTKTVGFTTNLQRSIWSLYTPRVHIPQKLIEHKS